MLIAFIHDQYALLPKHEKKTRDHFLADILTSSLDHSHPWNNFATATLLQFGDKIFVSLNCLICFIKEKTRASTLLRTEDYRQGTLRCRGRTYKLCVGEILGGGLKMSR